MRVTIRVSGDRPNGGMSTEAEVQVLRDGDRVRLRLDSSGGGIDSYSMRPEECRVLIAVLTEAMWLADGRSVTVEQAFKDAHAAGGHGWDGVDDPEKLLERK